MMKPIPTDVITAYIEEHTDPLPPLLKDLVRETRLQTGRLNWSIGRAEGKLLQMIVAISNARQVVEVGTFTGFSALLMAEALPTDGRLITCESEASFARIAQSYFDRSPHGNKIRLELGPAIESLARIPDGGTDFVFIDADKSGYEDYYEEALRILKAGGLVVADNVFWRGKVFITPLKNENARAIAAFNDKVMRDPRVEKVMLAVRDGCYLIRKR
ncbi:MAG: class I SAM-dependent methyltransferase [Desulfobacterales bacterium]|jgi:caffeoyl-CoA O-methyltransferase|nr:class I SAM-dependent methyltransferase [Desulfobacterales bacterium]